MNIDILRQITREFEKQAAGSLWRNLTGEPLRKIQQESRVMGSFWEPQLRDLSNAIAQTQQRLYTEKPSWGRGHLRRFMNERRLRALQKEKTMAELARATGMSEINAREQDIARRVGLARLGVGGVGAAGMIGLPLLYRQHQQRPSLISMGD